MRLINPMRPNEAIKEILQLSMVGENALFSTLENQPKASKKLIQAVKSYNSVVNVHDN
ncbi:hypothetical protein XNC1_4227 [Xenorhabdus nematophila ATCC 19061]|uniref:Uncharacterized protein n=1 Tax=Xenorhabdus nematophila (strain ATCC 19061 / DSM 3370 / CCUG 14189 / LMG 1036 / NCIMB 9965 / AN6) TaxID=406817 RepID=D3VDL0_XENNA|nr:hypothetical protein [Xenorhabdus nematophila]CBJ92250.1 hypothetical protein XNC1_4227 [Xenorhabdus nematophila ATCC 19061]CEE92543.1 hypothetical protein XNA1_2960006 [Xenorhabdus nematophila str. Anatoliense]CEK25065.1 hypothetical protein XNC2_4078 [Xenorhabdus nematophila AN6/1]